MPRGELEEYLTQLPKMIEIISGAEGKVSEPDDEDDD